MTKYSTQILLNKVSLIRGKGGKKDEKDATLTGSNNFSPNWTRR